MYFQVLLGYFYKPTFGVLKYIVDSDGHALYLINKAGLPKEIRDQLIGGDAGEGTFADYQNLNDVYGVTTDLKVYYSKGTGQELYGIDKSQLDNDNPLREVFTAGSPLATLLNGGDTTKNITAENAKSIKEINIDGSSINSLTELYNLTSLQILTLTNYKGSLSGLENATQLYKIIFRSCTISDYSSVGKMGNRLTSLEFFYNITDEEIEKFCSKSSTGVGNYDLNNLSRLSICHSERKGFNEETTSAGDDYRTSLTNIDPLSNLSTKTQEAVTHLFLYNNQITSAQALSGFKNVYVLHLENNYLTSTNGLENMKSLRFLHLANNRLGKNIDGASINNSTDSLNKLSSLSNLYFLNLNYNSDIVWISYIKDLNKLGYLYLNNDLKINDTDISKIISIVNNCGQNISIPSKYSLALLDENTTLLNLSGQTISKSSFESLKTKTKLQRLNLNGLKLTDSSNTQITNNSELNSTVNNVLSNLTDLQYLDLRNNTYISTIDFASNTKKLIEIVLLSTSVTDLTKLNNITTLRCLCISNTGIDLTSIQSTINRLDGGNYWMAGAAGLYATNWQLISQLSRCTDLTTLSMNYHDHAFWQVDSTLDLTALTRLKTINITRVVVKFKLPANLETFSLTYQYVPWDFSACVNLTSGSFSLFTYSDAATLKTMLSTMSNCNKLRSLDIQGRVPDIIDLTSLEPLKDLKELTSITIHGAYDGNSVLKSFKGIENLKNLTSFSSYGFSELTDISDLGKCIKLKTIYISGGKVTDISGLSTLSELEQLTVTGSAVSGVRGIENMKKLSRLNLQTNSLFDTSSYVDVNGNTISYNNLEIIAKLRNEAELRSIYLAGNAGIIDYSKLSSLTWNEKSGF